MSPWAGTRSCSHKPKSSRHMAFSLANRIPYSVCNYLRTSVHHHHYYCHPQNITTDTQKMVQLVRGITPAISPINKNPDPLNDLTILLNRLQRTILHADAEREARLKDNEYEREKAQQNLNYARSLLTKIEHEALSVKIHTRRQSLQTDLVRKRELLDQLSERLNDLAEFALANSQATDDNELDTSDDGEDILADIIATPSESLESTRSTQEGEEPEDTPPQSPVVAPQPPLAQTPQPKQDISPPAQPTTQTTSSLRPRTNAPVSPPSPSTAPSAETTARSALFGQEKTSSSTAIIKTSEAILDHQRAEQDALSESILKLASDLKASSQAFSQSLEEDKELVESTGQRMSKTGEGMEAVTKKMGMLQRMTEGKGWWGRMYLYAIVYGLMVALILFVGVMPKLRF
ncbi:hypothetical protein QBC38DRAFT_464545 [Podospora fimiseda]|uniref:Synaptobrevin n=1 Tax=Podospora fimiseda TaxID=252190 RepID=A0AAN7H2B6_9PEZI|nr:hypothetical protein QBC38DRAFT_464545 [Podospora fimiseda]